MSAAAKRLLRRTALIAVAAFISLALLLALPPVQLRLVRLIANSIDGVELELGYLWAGPRGIELKDLRVDIAGAGLNIDVAEAKIVTWPWSSLVGLGLHIENADLRGVDLNFDRAAPPAPAPETELQKNPFVGLKPAARLPNWLTLRTLQAAGNLAFKTATDIDVTGIWNVTAKSLEKATAASMNLSADLTATRLGEPLAAAKLGVDASAELDANSRIAGFAIAAELDPADDRLGLRATAAARLDEAEERYDIALDRATGERLAVFDALLESGGEFSANWEAAVTPGVIAAFARGRSVADLSGQATGHLAGNLGSERVEVQSSIEIQGRGWDAFDPRLADFGALDMRFELDGGIEPGILTAQTLNLALTSTERGDLLRVTALQPLRYELGNWLVDVATWGEPALRIEVSELPLIWLRRLSPTVDIQDGEFSGAVEFVRREERVTELHVTRPLRATGIQLAPVLDAALPAFDITLTPRATLSNGVLDANIEELTITAATGLQVAFQGQADTSQSTWPLIEFEGGVSGHVPALQRIMPQLDRIRGTTRLALDFSTLAMTISAAAVGADAVDGHTLFTADLSGQEPLRVRLPNFAPDWDAFQPQSASLRLDRVPLDWLSPFIPELEFRGGELSGEFIVAAAVGQGLVLQTELPLTITNVLPIYRGRAARGTWSASMRSRVALSTAMSSIALQDLVVTTRTGNALRADVMIEAPADGNRVAIDLTLDTDISELASAYGLRVNAVHWRNKGEIDTALRRLTVNELELDIEDSAGTDILRLESLRPFSIANEPFAVTVDGGSVDIIRATVTPVRLEQLLPNIFGLDLQGAIPSVEFFGRVDPDGGLVMATEGPLAFRDVSVRWGETTLLDRVSTILDYDVTYSSAGLEARSVDLTALASDGSVLLHTTSEVTTPLSETRVLDRASMTWEANLEPLARQPILANLPRFTAGTVVASLEFVNAAESTMTLNASLRDAVTTTLGSIPKLDLALMASGVRGERVELSLPVRLESQDFGVSDLSLDGMLSTGSNGIIDVEAAFTGERLAVGDLQTFIDLFVPPEQKAGTPEPSALTPLSEATLSAIEKLRAERHSVPFWTDALLAQTSVNIGSVVFPSFSVEDVRGHLELTHDRATLSDIHASMLGANLTAAANVGFDASLPKPYTLDFNAAIDEIELRNLFLAVSPDAVPTAEGHFELTSTLTGTGLNPLDLGLSTLGEMRLTGRDGIFRGLAAQAGTGSTATRVIGALTFSRELKAVARLLDGLGEIKFEEASFRFERSTPERIELRDLLVRAPQLRIAASGSLGLAPKRPLLLSPLDVSAQISARRDVGILFDGMDLLEESADEAGYRDLTRVVHVGGTPIEPDTSEFWNLLDEAAGNARGAFGAGLRTLNRRLEAARE